MRHGDDRDGVRECSEDDGEWKAGQNRLVMLVVDEREPLGVGADGG